MKFNFKRFLAFVLALVMVFGYVPAGAFATEIDYEEFTAMSPTQQRVYMESFESLDAFFEWYNGAKEVYEQAHPPIDVGDGVIDMEDIIG